MRDGNGGFEGDCLAWREALYVGRVVGELGSAAEEGVAFKFCVSNDTVKVKGK